MPHAALTSTSTLLVWGNSACLRPLQLHLHDITNWNLEYCLHALRVIISQLCS